MEKLISMTKFVEKKRCTTISTTDIATVLTSIFKYEMFLSKPLTLGMFVPVMSNGIIPTKEEVKTFEGTPLFEEYQEAKDRVLFKGFVSCITNRVQSVHHGNCCVHFQLLNKETIESISKCNIELTQTAQKQLS